MAYTGSLLGNYAPAMQEPYAIETALAKEATGGSSALANTLMNQYWFERQMREGQYADRMNDQMNFGKQQLHAQLLDQNMRAITEGAKTPGVLSMFASSPQYSGMFAGMDPNAIQATSADAEATAQAARAGNYGRFLSGAGAYGLTVPPAGISAATGIPNITPGTPTAVQAQTEANKGRVAAAAVRAAGSNAPTETDVYTPGIDTPQRTVKYRVGQGGYNTSVPPADASVKPAGPAAPSTPNQVTAAPPNYKKVDDATNAKVAAALEASKTVNPQQYRDAVAGYVGNKPNAFVDDKGKVVVQGKSGALIPLN